MKGTLKSRRAFSHIYDRGRRAVGAHVVVFALPEADGVREPEGAVGIVASRKVGNAPDRSRAKRVLRAALREVRSAEFVRGNVILVARRAMIEDAVKSTQLAAELRDLLGRTGSIRGGS